MNTCDRVGGDRLHDVVDGIAARREVCCDTKMNGTDDPAAEA
ncbi:hypothetical protein [Massilia phyllosphaerae]|nr:hypothetical protein [Massilia sp. SGZ-792]